MHVIVTGSEGFLGRKVVDRLATSGHSVVAVDRLFHSGETRENVVHHQSDLEDPSRLLPGSIPHGTPFVLVHLAWDMRRYQGYGIQAGQIRQFANLLDFWSEQGLQRLVMMGSAEEYGGRSGKLTEITPPLLPLSPYGWAKRASRDLASSWSERTGHPVDWLRPFIMYGPGQRGDMLIPSAIEAARQKQKTSFTDGRQRRDFIFIDDVVEAIVCCLARNLTGFHEFNLGRGEEIPVADVLTAIAKHYHVEHLFALGARSRRHGEPDVQVADMASARDVLGWEASVSWAEGMNKVLQDS